MQLIIGKKLNHLISGKFESVLHPVIIFTMNSINKVKYLILQ